MTNESCNLSEISSIINNDQSGHKLAQFLIQKNGVGNARQFGNLFGGTQRRISVRVDLMQPARREQATQHERPNSENIANTSANKLQPQIGVENETLPSRELRTKAVGLTAPQSSLKTNQLKTLVSSDLLRRSTLRRASKIGDVRIPLSESNATSIATSFSQFEPGLENLEGCTSTPITANAASSANQQDSNIITAATVQNVSETAGMRARAHTDQNAISMILTDVEGENESVQAASAASAKALNTLSKKPTPKAVVASLAAPKTSSGRNYDAAGEMNDDEDAAAVQKAQRFRKRAHTVIFNDSIPLEQEEQSESGGAGAAKNVPTSMQNNSVCAMAEITLPETQPVERPKELSASSRLQQLQVSPNAPTESSIHQGMPNSVEDCTANPSKVLHHTEKQNQPRIKPTNKQSTKRRSRSRSKRKRYPTGHTSSSSSEQSLTREQTRAATKNKKSPLRNRKAAAELTSDSDSPEKRQSDYQNYFSHLLRPTEISDTAVQQPAAAAKRHSKCKRSLLQNLAASREQSTEKSPRAVLTGTATRSLLIARNISAFIEQSTAALIEKQTPPKTKNGQSSKSNERVQVESSAERENPTREPSDLDSAAEAHSACEASSKRRLKSRSNRESGHPQVSSSPAKSPVARATSRSSALPRKKATSARESTEEQSQNAQSTKPRDWLRSRSKILKKSSKCLRVETAVERPSPAREPSPGKNSELVSETEMQATSKAFAAKSSKRRSKSHSNRERGDTQISSTPAKKPVNRLAAQKAASDRESTEEPAETAAVFKRDRQHSKLATKPKGLRNNRKDQLQAEELIIEPPHSTRSAHELSTVSEESEVLALPRTSTPFKKSTFRERKRRTVREDASNREQAPTPIAELTPTKSAPLSQVFPRQKTPTTTAASPSSPQSPVSQPKHKRQKSKVKKTKNADAALAAEPTRESSPTTSTDAAPCPFRRSQRERRPTKIEPYAIEIYTRAYFPERLKKNISGTKTKKLADKRKKESDNMQQNLQPKDNEPSDEPLQAATEKSLVSWLQSTSGNAAASSLYDTHVPCYDGHFLSRELLQFQNHKDIELRFYDEQTDSHMLGYIIFKPSAIKKMVTLKHSGMKFVCMSGRFKFTIKGRTSADPKEYCATTGDAFAISVGDTYGIENLSETENGHIMMIKN